MKAHAWRFHVLVWIALAASVLAGIYVWGSRGEGLWGNRREALVSSARALEPQMALQQIHRVDLDVVVAPGEGEIDVSAALDVEARRDGLNELVFFLNAALDVQKVTVDEESVTFSHRRHVLRVRPIGTFDEGARHRVCVKYAGGVGPAFFEEPAVSPDAVVLPALALWYPWDLTSFSEYECAVRVPSDMTVVTPGAGGDAAVSGGECVFRWFEPRPVFGIPLLAGRLSHAQRIQGNVRCAVYWPVGEEVAVEGWLRDMGSAHNGLISLYGDVGFKSLTLLLSTEPGVRERGGFRCGNSVFVLPYAGPDEWDEASRFLDIAVLAAGNWFGGTVVGNWLSAKPEGAFWMEDALARYGAWEALRKECGREAYLRCLERSEKPRRILVPLKQVGLLDAEQGIPGRGGPGSFGVFLARMLAEQVGEEAFARACRNVLSVHRFSSLSYASFRQELELCAGLDLGEVFHEWFDEGGVFDCALAQVELDRNRVMFSVENRGDFPLPSSLDVALFGDEEVRFQTIEPGANGGTFVFSTEGEVHRIVLDPEFKTGDMMRANNTWPRRAWPRGFSVSRGGDIAWWSAEEWWNPDIVTVSAMRVGSKSILKASVSLPLKDGPQWDGDGGEIAWTCADEHDRALRIFCWAPGGKTTMRVGDPGQRVRLIGWLEKQRVLGFDERPDGRWLVFGDELRALQGWAAGVPPSLASGSGCALRPGGSEVAYVAREGGEIRVFDPETGAEKRFLRGPFSPEALEWTEDGGSVVFFDGQGRLIRAGADGASSETVLELGYVPGRVVFSEGGSLGAWLDPEGRPRFVSLDARVPEYLGLEGELVAWEWQGDLALWCLTVEMPRSLPMHYHGDYHLWRVPMDRQGEAEEPVDLTVLN